MTNANEIVNELGIENPFQFDGLDADQEWQGDFESLTGPETLKTQAIGVLRAGENRHGTWGYVMIVENGRWKHVGYTLEPRGSAGKGPIPVGNFPARRWVSPRLKKTIRLLNVPGFTNILIHVGNTQADTTGCILVGRGVDNLKDPSRLVDSRKLVDALFDAFTGNGVVAVRSR